METFGKYYDLNQKKLCAVNDDTLRVVNSKCKYFIEKRLYQRTLYGAHNSSNLGDDPVSYYYEDAIDSIISGRWEWKDEFDLLHQLIRIINSKISKEVDKTKTTKAQSLKIKFTDIEAELYDCEMPDDSEDQEQNLIYEKQVVFIENAIKDYKNLTELFDLIKAGYKRREIAEYMDIEPKRVDKLIEQLKEKVNLQKPPKTQIL